MKLESDSNIEVTTTLQGSTLQFAEGSESLIAQLVTQNLYNDPIGSIVREVVSNAYDSTVRSNSGNNIIVKITKSDSNSFYFIVQDYGTGMSPETVEKNYASWFGSDKRNSNNEIGGFGIGAKVPLSLVDLFEVSTVFNSIKYEYLIYNDSGVIKHTLVSSEPTADLNGTKIVINLPQKYLYKFIEAIGLQLPLFDNIIYDIEGKVVDNEYVILKGVNWKYRVNNDKCQVFKPLNFSSLCVGNVVYPIPNHIEIKDAFKYISLDVPIGKVKPVLNRESIEILPETLEYLKKEYYKASQDIITLFKKYNDFELDHTTPDKDLLPTLVNFYSELIEKHTSYRYSVYRNYNFKISDKYTVPNPFFEQWRYAYYPILKYTDESGNTFEHEIWDLLRGIYCSLDIRSPRRFINKNLSLSTKLDFILNSSVYMLSKGSLKGHISKLLNYRHGEEEYLVIEDINETSRNGFPRKSIPLVSRLLSSWLLPYEEIKPTEEETAKLKATKKKYTRNKNTPLELTEITFKLLRGEKSVNGKSVYDYAYESSYNKYTYLKFKSYLDRYGKNQAYIVYVTNKTKNSSVLLDLIKLRNTCFNQLHFLLIQVSEVNAKVLSKLDKCYSLDEFLKLKFKLIYKNLNKEKYTLFENSDDNVVKSRSITKLLHYIIYYYNVQDFIHLEILINFYYGRPKLKSSTYDYLYNLYNIESFDDYIYHKGEAYSLSNLYEGVNTFILRLPLIHRISSSITYGGEDEYCELLTKLGFTKSLIINHFKNYAIYLK